jgi:sugar phosphate isomerase/epimerase
VPEGATEDQAAGWVADNLKAASDYSGSKGIILGLENHGGITAKADRVVQIVKAVNSPWVGINLDTGNFERDGYRQLETCLPYAVNSQVKVEIRDEKGERQKSDWDRILNMYAQAGYKGYLALEYEANDDARKSVPPLTLELNRLARRHSHPTA